MLHMQIMTKVDTFHKTAAHLCILIELSKASFYSPLNSSNNTHSFSQKNPVCTLQYCLFFIHL